MVRYAAKLGWGVDMKKKELMQTQFFLRKDADSASEAERCIVDVSRALSEKGYDPVNQIVGYLLSGDPTYITAHNNARVLIGKFECHELLEEMVASYLKSRQ